MQNYIGLMFIESIFSIIYIVNIKYIYKYKTYKYM